jgi:hypothetical protein
MKTAMQELIELLELNTRNEPLPYLIDAIKQVYIPKEKKQLLNAYDQGVEDENERAIAEHLPNHSPSFKCALDYYNREYYNKEYGEAGRKFTQDLIPKN